MQSQATIIYFSVCFLQAFDDARTENLRKLSYGVILPIICFLGIVGNFLNLVVLTRKCFMHGGTAYVYMRGQYARNCRQICNLNRFFPLFVGFLEKS